MCDLTCNTHRRRNDAGGLQHVPKIAAHTIAAATTVDNAVQIDNKTRKGLTIGVPRHEVS